ncbi:MAG TPA: carboxypeptidase-like regulatory domain-containing protein [Thermoplasmata archaeon]|nr:carboxypeptidase-like regulatory domain-containing protein [Thermoplasmata archaeon]
MWAGLGAIIVVALFAFPGSSSMLQGSHFALAPFGAASGARSFASSNANSGVPHLASPVWVGSGPMPTIVRPVRPVFAAAPTLASGTSTASANSPIAPPARPAATSNPYRTAIFTGFVDDARSGRPLIGVTITWESQGGICPVSPGNCTPTRTFAPNGNFSIRAPAPQDTILASSNGYLTNFSSVSNVTPGQVYALGTINLTKEGIVSGIIVGSDPTHERVKCTVLVSSISRSSLTLGANGTFSTGTFSLPVPPFPSVISFDPKCPQYQPNQYWINVSAYSTYNMGLVELPVNVMVQVNVYDSVTKKAITGQVSEIQVCSYGNPGNCGPKGPATTNGAPKAWAPPGYDVATVWANDLNGEPGMTNITMIGLVPAVAPGHIFRVTPVYIVPLGIMSIDVGLTYARQLKAEGVTTRWGIGLAVVSLTSLNGYTQWSSFNPLTGNFSTTAPPTTCVNVGQLSGLFAPPLRDAVQIVPDTAGTCFPPAPTWPVPNLLPAWGNNTIVNVTPDNRFVTPAGWVNLTPGTYVEGGIYGNDANPVNGQSLVSISATSTDQSQNAISSASFTTYVSAEPAPPNHPGFDVSGCVPNSWNIFCVPVPFGPSEITAKGPTISNFTWVDVPPGYYTTGPMLIQSFDTAPLVHITAGGAVTASGGYGALEFANASVEGRLAVQGSGGVPYGLGTIIVAPAGTPPSQETSSTCTSDPTTGSFICAANPGWNIVTATGPLYLTNFTWVYVPSSSALVNAGTIYLTPLTTIQGRVVTSNGVGILQASAQYCPIASQTSASCQNLGTTGTTNTNGQYSGLVPPYPLPRGAYKLIFTATGYSSNWTWVNATVPGGIINASTVALNPLSSAPAAVAGRANLGMPAASGPNPVQAEWVVGNVTDNATGLPVQGLTIQWAPTGGAPNSVGSTDINALDDYNTSIPIGPVYINYSANGYLPASIYINVTGFDQSAVDFLPTVTMQPETFFTGRVEIGPGNWSQVSTQLGLGPGATNVRACTRALVCGATSFLNTGGFFNISGPTMPNQFEVLRITPTGTAVGTLLGGFSASQGYANFSGQPTVVNMSTEVTLDIFGVVIAQVFDMSTNNTTAVRWPTATLINGVGSINTSSLLYGGGGLIFGATQSSFGKNSLSIQASASAYLQGTLKNGSVDWGQAVFLGNLSLPHYGWVAGPVYGTVGKNVSVPWATVSLTTYNGSPPLATGAGGTANGAGYINVTAPPGVKGTLQVMAPDYNSSNASGFGINQSATSTLSVLLKKELGGLTPWGWVTGTVQDNAHQFSLPLALIDVTSRYGTKGTQTTSNGAGAYFIDAPPGPSANVSINLTDYIGNFTHVSVLSGKTATAHLVNLTGDGIVAGFVQSYPTGLPIPFANVSLCSQAQPLCSNIAIANGSGYFVIAGPPGLDNLTVSYNHYVTTFRPVNVTSDGWTNVGKVLLDEYAFLSGTVIGLPSGIPVAGANVSACSPLAFSEGAVICAYATQTSNNGEFFLAVPADNYIIQVNATLYNTTFLPIQLLPGETVSMGLIELEQYGIAAGYVYGADTQGPLSNSQVTACPTWENGNCTSVTTNRLTGQYLFEGPPGPYAVTASAPNYATSGMVVKLVSGSLVKAATIYLQPIGPAERFTISGLVMAQSTAPGGADVPYAGALVSDNVGDTATTDAQGQFVMSVAWGDIVITVTARGYQAAHIPEQVRGNISGVSVTLVPMTYAWTGYVTDGISRQALNGTLITLGLGGITVATSDPTGHYSVQFPNGTFYLDAGFTPGSLLASAYPTVAFVVTVNGAGGTRDISMFPPLRTLDIQVVSRPSGIPLSNASVVVAGNTRPEGVGLTLSGSTNFNGSVGIGVYTGIYSVTASASGYLTGSVQANTTGSNSTLAVLVELAPISAPVSAGYGGGITPLVGVALAGGVVALAAGLYVFTRRLSASPRAPGGARPASGGAE